MKEEDVWRKEHIEELKSYRSESLARWNDLIKLTERLIAFLVVQFVIFCALSFINVKFLAGALGAAFLAIFFTWMKVYPVQQRDKWNKYWSDAINKFEESHEL